MLHQRQHVITPQSAASTNSPHNQEPQAMNLAAPSLSSPNSDGLDFEHWMNGIQMEGEGEMDPSLGVIRELSPKDSGSNFFPVGSGDVSLETWKSQSRPNGITVVSNPDTQHNTDFTSPGRSKPDLPSRFDQQSHLDPWTVSFFADIEMHLYVHTTRILTSLLLTL
jgi:hypothetical protein